MIHQNLRAVTEGQPVPVRPVLTAPNGSKYELVVSNTGTVTAVAIDDAQLPKPMPTL